MKTLALGALCALLSCGRSELDRPAPVEAPTPSIASAHHERFVGLWVLEQPTHALYEATLYRFEASGALVTVRSIDLGGHLRETGGVTGTVGNCAEGPACRPTVICLFGSEWRSPDASSLIISGRCSDQRPRDLAFAFADDPSSNVEPGPSFRLSSVGGEQGWSHNSWPWAFRKCAPGAPEQQCLPFGGP